MSEVKSRSYLILTGAFFAVAISVIVIALMGSPAKQDPILEDLRSRIEVVAHDVNAGIRTPVDALPIVVEIQSETDAHYANQHAMGEDTAATEQTLQMISEFYVQIVEASKPAKEG